MADRWIITSYKFREHKTLAEAQAELERVRAKITKREFQIIRIKTTVEQGDSYAKMVGALRLALAALGEGAGVAVGEKVVDDARAAVIAALAAADGEQKVGTP